MEISATLKQFIKKVVGQESVTWTKQHVKYIRDIIYLRNHPRINIMKDGLLYQKFFQKGKHVFGGYYDIPQIDVDEKKMLVHVVGEKADAKKDTAELGYYNLNTCEYIPFASTRAWCWQQGARLRWCPCDHDAVLYNDVENGQYISRVFDLKEMQEIGKFCTALYDVSSDMKYGLSLNFSRLQRLRPGYGYNTLPDMTDGMYAPDNDGIFYVDLKTNQRKLLISLSELAAEVHDPQANEHYINHISIAPDCKHFMFFHIWTLKGDTHWRTRLCVYNLESQEMKVLEDKDRVSHYDWINDSMLLTTCWDSNRNQYYCIYDIEGGSKRVLKQNRLCHDGHPTVLSDEKSFISDTYPLDHDMQSLFEYKIADNHYHPLLRLYSDALQYEEKRCDLHPRTSKNEQYITLDTTCENHCRQVLLLRNWR